VYNLPIITIDKYINSIQFYPLQKLLKKFVLNYRSDLENQNNINNAIASLLEIIEYIDKIVTGSLLISSNNREIYDMIYSKKNVESSVYTKDDLHKLLKTVWINSNIQSGGLIESTFKITKMRDEYFGYYTDTLKSVKIYRYFISRFFWIDCSADIELVMKSKLEIDINNDIMYKNFGETISKYNIGKLMADNLENLLSYYIQNFNKKMKQYELYVHLVSYLRDIGVFYDISETIVNPILDSILEKKCNYWLELYPDHPSSYDYIEVEEVDLSNYAKKVNKYIKYYYILTNFFDVSKYSDYFNELSDTMEYEELVDRLRNIVFDKILKDLLERNEFNKVFDSIRNVGYESHQIEKLYEISDYFNSVFYVRKNKERIPVETQTITFYNIEYDGVLSYKPIDYKIFLQYIDSNKTKS
jgi:hypothetical protein